MRGALVALTVTALLGGHAAGAGETARQILDRRKALEDTTQHWNDRQQRMKLKVTGGAGGERTRELEVFEKKYPGDEQKAIVFFHAPAEVKDTAFLSFNHKGRRAEQWLYLPNLKRIRQITANIRHESFVGTDLTYHDLDLLAEMTSWSEDDARSQLRGDETIGGTPCHAIELTPQREDIGYQRVVLWLGRDDLAPRQVEFYEQPSGSGWSLFGGGGSDATPKKRVRQSDVRLVGQIPFAYRVDVESPGTGSKTGIDITEVRFDQHLADDFFSQRQMELGVR